jgi:hypothetical protein
MLDLALDQNHTFYVDYGGAAVLVHAVRALNPADRAELQEILEKRIANRTADQTSGVFSQVDPGHTARIAQEQSLLYFLKSVR